MWRGVTVWKQVCANTMLVPAWLCVGAARGGGGVPALRASDNGLGAVGGAAVARQMMRHMYLASLDLGGVCCRPVVWFMRLGGLVKACRLCFRSYCADVVFARCAAWVLCGWMCAVCIRAQIGS